VTKEFNDGRKVSDVQRLLESFPSQMTVQWNMLKSSRAMQDDKSAKSIGVGQLSSLRHSKVDPKAFKTGGKHWGWALKSFKTFT